MDMVIRITTKKPEGIDRYLRAIAEMILLFKIAYDIIDLLARWLI